MGKQNQQLVNLLLENERIVGSTMITLKDEASMTTHAATSVLLLKQQTLFFIICVNFHSVFLERCVNRAK